MVGLIPQVLQPGQLLVAHLGGDLLQDPVAGHLIGQMGDDDVALLQLVAGALAQAAVSGLVELPDLLGGGDDGRRGGIVRAGDEGHQLGHAGPGMVQEVDAGPRHLPQVVGRDIGGHAHGDARRPVEQQVGQAGGQNSRLLQGAVEVGLPVHRALAQLAEQDLGVGGQPRLGVAHGGEGLGFVGGSPVTLAVDERIAVGEGLGHKHHGLVAGGVAMGVELAQDIAHGARRLLVLGGGGQAQLGHGVEDAPLHRLEAIPQVRQGAVEDDVHGIVQVGLLAEDMQGAALDALGGKGAAGRGVQGGGHVKGASQGSKGI